jgi:nitroreductase
METMDAIRTRRDVRQFEPEPIPDEVLTEILEAARRTPSSSNQQRWDFVCVTDRSLLEQLSHVWQGAKHVATSAATVVLVAPYVVAGSDRDSTFYDLGQATMSLALAATEHGVGSAHAKVDDEALTREILGLPPDRIVPYMVPLGYPADRPLRPIEKPARRPFHEVVHFDAW